MKSCFLAPKHDFHLNSRSGAKIAPGPPKTSPERYVYKGFCEGGAFGAQKPKKRGFGVQNAVLGAWAPRGAVLFMKHQVFPKEYQWFWHVGNHEILENFMIFMKNPNFLRNRRRTFLTFGAKMIFSHLGGRLP